MSVSNLEKEVGALDSKTKTISQSVDELKESLSFCLDEIAVMKKNAYHDVEGESYESRFCIWKPTAEGRT